MFSESDLLPISALQHLAFCERQWGLIHLENVWEENRLTVEGKHLHDRADSFETESRGDVRIARAAPLRCLRLGLTGKADVIEFHKCGPGEEGALLAGMKGLWRPVPVEYKRGKPKRDHCDEVQLCAQALCIEEMLGVEIPEGHLFYGEPRRRTEVALGPALRGETEALAARMHELYRARRTPQAEYGKMCRSCSLVNVCMPKAGRSAKRYLARVFEEEPESGKEAEINRDAQD